MDQQELIVIMHQIHFFNDQFHASEGQDELQDFHELMRASKNRCQLMLLKFASPDLVWIKKDESSPNQEWSLGVHGFPEEYARHIPLHVLQQSLSQAQLDAWKIQ